MKYRKKPVIVEAMKFEDNRLKELKEFCPSLEPNFIDLQYFNEIAPTTILVNASIETLEGTMVANIGDYIIKGVNGEFYPCKPDIFEKTYEVVEQ